MRGKEFVIIWNATDQGITPAYAGKRERGCQRMKSEEDHPRVCGEKMHMLDTYCVTDWITPAYAGKRTGRLQI